MSWTVETYSEVTHRWHVLATEQRTYCLGLFDGLTDYTRCSTPIRLVNSHGDVVKERMNGEINLGMTSMKRSEAPWELLAKEIAGSSNVE